MLTVALDVLRQELPAHAASRDPAVVAIVPSPFREMVCNVKRCRRRYCVFVVDEVHTVGIVFRRSVASGWELDHVGREKVAVRKNQLES